jgi:hypothetical protein
MKIEKDMDKNKMYKAFVKKYPNISPIIIFKTLEFTSSFGKAFDALEDYNGDLPITWDSANQKWMAEVLLEYDFLQGKD